MIMQHKNIASKIHTFVDHNNNNTRMSHLLDGSSSSGLWGYEHPATHGSNDKEGANDNEAHTKVTHRLYVCLSHTQPVEQNTCHQGDSAIQEYYFTDHLSYSHRQPLCHFYTGAPSHEFYRVIDYRQHN